MARTKNVSEHAARRDAILDSVQRLLLAKGYERLTVQDVLDDLQISKGAFYHYFGSKPAMIEALIERLVDESERLLAPIVADADTRALDKLRQFFGAVVSWKSGRQELFVAMLPIWYSPDNVTFHQKVDHTVAARLQPLLSELIRQGVDEDVFTVSHPQHAAKIVLTLVQSLQDSMAHQLLDSASAANLTAAHSAHLEAIERYLGTPPGALPRIDTATVETWITAVANADAQGVPRE